MNETVTPHSLRGLPNLAEYVSVEETPRQARGDKLKKI